VDSIKIADGHRGFTAGLVSFQTLENLHESLESFAKVGWLELDPAAGFQEHHFQIEERGFQQDRFLFP